MICPPSLLTLLSVRHALPCCTKVVSRLRLTRNMLWSCPISSTKKWGARTIPNSLSTAYMLWIYHYPLHAGLVLILRVYMWSLQTDKIEFVVARTKHNVGFWTLQFAFQCHEIVEVMQLFQIWGVNDLVLIFLFAVSTNSGTVLCTQHTSTPTSAHLIIVFYCMVENSFIALLMPWQMLMKTTQCDEARISSCNKKQNFRNALTWYTISWSKTPSSSSSTIS